MTLPTVPKNLPLDHQTFLTEVKKILDRIQPPNIAPGRPTNLKVNPLPGGNQILFTAGDNADGHLLLFSPTQNFDPTQPDNGVVDLSQSTHYTHVVGIPGVKRFYWLVAQRGDQKSDPPTGPVAGTTLGLAIPATPHPYVPPSQNIVKSNETGKPTILVTRRGGSRNLL